MAVFDHTQTDPCHPAHILVDHRGVGARLRLPRTGCRNSHLASRSSHILSRSPGEDSLRRNHTRRLIRLPEFQPLTTMVAMETPADMDGIQGNDHSREEDSTRRRSQ